MQETWKTINGFEEYYEVSDCGRVRSLPRTVVRSDGVVSQYRNHKLRILSPNPDGYLCVSLCVDRKSYPRKVHRLVADAFCENASGGNEVNHKNFDITDNRACNLEWVTGKQNSSHSMVHGRKALKLCDHDVRIMRALRGMGICLKELAQCFSVSESVISEVCNRKAWGWVA